MIRSLNGLARCYTRTFMKQTSNTLYLHSRLPCKVEPLFIQSKSFSLGGGDENQKGLFQRFKDAYKQYGKTLVAVHVVTSCVWFTSFYSAAHYGLDITPILERFLEPETIEKAQNSPLGHAAIAYLMYKLVTPARYAVTIGGTQVTVKQLKRMGVWKEIDEKEKLGSLLREGKDNVKDKMNTKIKQAREKMNK
ncbi:DgyrCDS1614 [Dimorphilus gyrociliatus]|uniref:DgyrCDS1614 n=1 Tax=Dimorphilus gyrociliatus TaxID=2664684 RepID=A0A7I8VA00_9ANNE|nr:DgyrCDS1614 [Dimorphilus gyrociliatus]